MTRPEIAGNTPLPNKIHNIRIFFFKQKTPKYIPKHILQKNKKTEKTNQYAQKQKSTPKSQ